MTPNTAVALPSADRFSWRRVAMIARYYYLPLRRAIILFPLLSFAVGMFSFFSIRYEINIFFSGTLSTILSFLYYWSPIIFNRVEQSQLTLSLPCRWSERATFVMLFSLIGLPILIFAPSYLLSELGKYLYNDNYVSLLSNWNIDNNSIVSDPYKLLNLSMSLFPFSVTLYTMFRARKNRPLKAMLLSLAAMVGETIFIGVVSIIFVMRYMVNNTVAENSICADAIPADIMSATWWIVGSIVGALAIMFIVLTIRRFKTVQIS